MLDIETVELIRTEVQALTHIDSEKLNANSKPFYVGPIMVLSDQDLTALKHHVLSSAVMGTVFVGLIATISNPEIPLILRILLTGSVLTGMQTILVGTTNVAVATFELWERAKRPLPFRWCLRCLSHAAERCWQWWVQSHVIQLDNGATVWIDGFQTFLLDDGTDTAKDHSDE